MVLVDEFVLFCVIGLELFFGEFFMLYLLTFAHSNKLLKVLKRVRPNHQQPSDP